MKSRIEICEALHSERIKKGLSLRALGSMTGIDYTRLSRIERGEYSAGIDMLLTICQALDVELDLKDSIK